MFASLINRTDRNGIRDLWDKLEGYPGGKRLFSKLIGRAAPYTGTIDGRVLELRQGFSKVELRDRHGVRNHLSSVHAIALANLAELAGNLALVYSMPDDARFIVAGMTLDYLKKARGTLTATCEAPAIKNNAKHEYSVPVTVFDAASNPCVKATLRTLVGPRPA